MAAAKAKAAPGKAKSASALLRSAEFARVAQAKKKQKADDEVEAAERAEKEAAVRKAKALANQHEQQQASDECDIKFEQCRRNVAIPTAGGHGIGEQSAFINRCPFGQR